MSQYDKKLSQYYSATSQLPHKKRTEVAVKLDNTGFNVAVDAGCGAGNDIQFLHDNGYTVHAFDKNEQAVHLCNERFNQCDNLLIEAASFETFTYPFTSVLIANASLFFALPDQFQSTWDSLSNSLIEGGVFSGDFMGCDDEWVDNYPIPLSHFTEAELKSLFTGFHIEIFDEIKQKGKTALGKEKLWHSFSVVAVKQSAS